MSQELENIKNELYGKTAGGFSLTWEPEKNALLIKLTSKNKDTTYAKTITECSWSFFPFTEEQTRILETKILGSNLDMWICYQKMVEFIQWFCRRNRSSIGGMVKLKENSIFSSDEYDYLEYMKLPNWDLYSIPDTVNNVDNTKYELNSEKVETKKSGYIYNRFMHITSFGGWIGNFWWVNRDCRRSFLELSYIGSFGFDGNPQFILGTNMPYKIR